MTSKPLAAVALAFAGGLLLGELFQPPLALLFGAALGVIGCAAACGSLRARLLWPAIVLSAWAIHNTQLAVLSPCDLRSIAWVNSDQPRLVTVRGSLFGTPSLRATQRDGKTVGRTRAYLRVTGVRSRHSAWMQASGLVIATGPGPLPTGYFTGQQVELIGVLARAPGAPAPGLFDYGAYLKRRGVHFTLQTSELADWRLTGQPTASLPWTDRFLHWAQRVLGYGLPEPDEALDLLRGMTLGSTAELTAEDFDPFVRSGTMHIFAISGLHIVLISHMLWQLFRVMLLSRRTTGALTLPLIWFYTAATGWQPSAVRATIMMSIIIGGWMLARPANMLNSLSVAAILVLAFDPHQLFGASFQLSFFVVLSLALFMPGFKERIDRWLAYDPLLPPELATRGQRWSRWCARHALLAVAVSLAAWLGALPLTARYFNLVGPITLLANVFVVPLSNIALAANMGGLVTGDWAPWLTEAFNNCSWLSMKAIVWLSRQAVEIPGSHWFIPTPTVLDCVLYYGVLIGVAAGVFSNAMHRPYAWTTVCLALLVVAGEWTLARPVAELTVLPVESGATVFVRDRIQPTTLLIDSGTSNSVKYLVNPFLRSQGCNRLEGLLLTHGDAQHIEGTRLVDASFSAKHLLVSNLKFRSPVYRGLMDHYQSTPGKLRTLVRPDHLGNWHILHPGMNDRPREADDASLVLWGTFSPTAPTVLVLPDLNETGQRKLLDAYPSFRADVIIASMPANGEPLIPELITALQPRVILLQDPKYPHDETPRPALRNRLAQTGAKVLYTSEQGAVTLSLKSGVWDIRTMKGLRATLHPASLGK